MRCTEGPKQTSDGLGAFLTTFGKVLMSYLDVTKDTALVIKLITLIGVQIFTEPAPKCDHLAADSLHRCASPEERSGDCLLVSPCSPGILCEHSNWVQVEGPASSSLLWILLCPFTAHYQQRESSTEKKDVA